LNNARPQFPALAVFRGATSRAGRPAGNWAAQHCAHVDHHDVDAACRDLVHRLGRDGWLNHSAPGDHPSEKIDVRTLALIRETLARHSGLADFAFAMQGLGAGPISLFGTAAQKAQWLPKTRSGAAIAAFALSEPASGSDVANISTTARRDRDGFTLDGEKTWISNGASPIFTWYSPVQARALARRAYRRSSCAATIPACRLPSVSR
jgi:alkylation response protein AidB-like acyl-CoA dehydrogenase